MNKKHFMFAILLGAMTLGSCVDDNESASVTAVRTAKVEQLKSIAAINNAEAQAKLLLANAQAALTEAQAAQTKAVADKEAAEAKIKELEAKLAADSYDAKLAAELAQAEAAKKAAEYQIQLSQGNIDSLVLSMQKTLAQLQTSLLQAQKDLADKQDALADAKMTELQTLANEYTGFLEKYTGAQVAIAKQNADILAAENELKDWEVLAASTIAGKELQIQIYESQIANLKKYTNYTEDLDKAKIELQNLLNAKNLAYDKYTPLYNAYNALDIDQMKTDKKISDLQNAIEATNMYKLTQTPWELDCTWMLNCGYDVKPLKTYERDGFEIKKGEYTYYNYNSDSLNVEMKYKDVRQFTLFVNEQIAYQDVAGKKEAINKAETGYKAVYDAAVKASAAADKAYKAAAEEDKAAKLAELKDALNDENVAKSNYDAAVANLETSEKNVESMKLVLSLVSDPKQSEDFVAAVKAYNEAIVAIYTEKANANFAMQDAQKAKDDADLAYNALAAIMNGTAKYGYYNFNLYDLFYGNSYGYSSNMLPQFAWNNNYGASLDMNELTKLSIILRIPTGNGTDGAIGIDEAIKNFEDNIADLKEEIADLKDTTSAEQSLTIMKAELESMNVQLATLKIVMDAKKAKLDAAVAEASK